ncbi:hypothetical protein QZH41_019525 [Actinostola sp. cb2023]|nr:hypothetical protein QZH41_019525 [Actinostola sp. cb2023]
MEVEKRTYSRSKSAIQRGEVQESRTSKRSPRKRTYQRDQNPSKICWQSRDQASSSSPNDDLRSPCHKHPRFKGQKENAAANRPSANKKGPWNKKAESSNDENGKMQLENKEFPPLGFNLDSISSFTPESNKDWGTIVEEEEQEQANKQNNNQSQKPLKFKRRLLLSAPDSIASEPKDSTKNQTEEDKSKTKTKKVLRPMITDPHKLTQRQKQIDIGKNTVSYGHFIKTVQRDERSKEDPWTPDKFQQCSTRSWVGQIKVWRRRLHVYDLSSVTKEELFSTSSASSSQESEDTSVDVEESKKSSSIEDMFTNVDVEESKKSSSIEDMFQDFDLDSCLIHVDDGYPL